MPSRCFRRTFSISLKSASPTWVSSTWDALKSLSTSSGRFISAFLWAKTSLFYLMIESSFNKRPFGSVSCFWSDLCFDIKSIWGLLCSSDRFVSANSSSSLPKTWVSFSLTNPFNSWALWSDCRTSLSHVAWTTCKFSEDALIRYPATRTEVSTTSMRCLSSFTEFI